MKKLLFLALLLIGSSSFSQKITTQTSCSGSGSANQGTYTYEANLNASSYLPGMKDVRYKLALNNYKITSFTYKGVDASTVSGVNLPIYINNIQAKVNFSLEYFVNRSNITFNNLTMLGVQQGQGDYADLTSSQIESLKNRFNIKDKSDFYNLNLRINSCKISKSYFEELSKIKRLIDEKIQNNPNQQNDDNPSSGDDSQETPKQTGANPNQQNSGAGTNYPQLQNQNLPSKEVIIANAVVDFTQQIIASGIFKSDPEARAKRKAKRKRLREKYKQNAKIAKEMTTQLYEGFDPFFSAIYKRKKNKKANISIIKFPNGAPFYFKSNSKLKKVQEGHLYGYKVKRNWVIKPTYLLAYPFYNGKAVVGEQFQNQFKAKIIDEEDNDITLMAMSRELGDIYSKNQNTDVLLKYIEENEDLYKNTDDDLEVKINYIAYFIMKNKKSPEEALKIFIKNVQLFPDSFNVYDSLGECLLELGLKEEAKKAYENSLEINPVNTNAIKVLKNI